MKAQTIRPKVQNGSIARRAPRGETTASRPTVRRTTRSTVRKTAPAQTRTSRRRTKPETQREPDSKIFWMIIVLGTLLTAGFLFGVRSQINTLQLNQAEEKLRDQIDRYSAEQKYLNLDQQRALSPRSREQAVKESGLVQMKLDAQPKAFYTPAKLSLKPEAAPESADEETPQPASAPVAVATNKPTSGKPLFTRSRALQASESAVRVKKVVKERPLAGPRAEKKAEPRGTKNKAVKNTKPAAAKSPKAKTETGKRPTVRASVRRS